MLSFGWFGFLGYGYLPVGGTWALVSIYKILRGKYESRGFWIASLVASMYVVGNGFKMLILGPQFLRWHLSDFGFPAFIGFMLSVHGRVLKHSRSEQITVAMHKLRVAKNVFRTTCIAIGLAVCYEVFVGILFRSAGDRVDTKQLFVGNFDWLDILAYCVGGTVALGAHRWSVKFWQSIVDYQAPKAEILLGNVVSDDEKIRRDQKKMRSAKKAKRRRRSPHHSTPRR